MPKPLSPRPSLLLLPGALRDRRPGAWAAKGRRLRGQVCTIVADLRAMRSVPDWARRLLTRLPARFAVAGHSLGGLLAHERLGQVPDRVDRLALIAGNAEAGNRRGGRGQQTLSRLWRAERPAAVARCVKPACFHHRAQRSRHVSLVGARARHTPTGAAKALFRWAAERPEGLSDLALHHAPRLIDSGANGRLCPPALQRRLQTMRPDASRAELPRGGHRVPLETPAPPRPGDFA